MKTAAGALLGQILWGAAPVHANEGLPVAFPAVDPDEPTAIALHCTEKPGWCARIEKPDGRQVFLRVQPEGADQPLSVTLELDEAPELEDISLWNRIVPLEGGDILLGVERIQRNSYSGGSGETTWLVLYRIGTASSGSPFKPVLSVAANGKIVIRACFGADDIDKRLQACEDEYAFSGELSFLPGTNSLPAIDYMTEARAYPAPARRSQDSSRLPPLTQADLTWATDKVCSVQRRFVFDDARGIYVPDLPLPDCSDYTRP